MENIEQYMDDWREAFIANYRGETPEAKELADYLKSTYQGAKYIPWATMERLVYQQDPWATFEKVKNENGGLVFSTYDNVETYQRVVKDGVEQLTETKSQIVHHFVRVRLTFMGKDFEEDYPIQDNKYAPVRVPDANAINKSLQRALAKVASRGTGLALRLFEGHDLQFEEESNAQKTI